MIEFINSLNKIKERTDLNEKEMLSSISAMMQGDATEAQMGAFLMGLSQKGETIPEITGAAQALREKVTPIKAPIDSIDCCGTGGDASGTYNISTAVALVSAACGVPVAKHGNRAASSKSGAADVLEALGVNLELETKALEHALKEYNFCFLMAPRHHQAMKHVVPVRKQLGFRTIFNLLGPLANPAGTKFQLIGVYNKDLLEPMAQVLKNLGTKRAWIVHGDDGLDEITITTSTQIALLEDGKISTQTLSPDDFGLEACDPLALKGDDAAENARALQCLLNGSDGGYRDIVLANTAAALMIHGSVSNLKDGVKKAEEAIDNKQALSVLEKYISYSRDQ